MDHYIEAIRAAAAASSPRDLKPALDFLVDQARDDYKAGALAVHEYGDIINEYAETLREANVINYM